MTYICQNYNIMSKNYYFKKIHQSFFGLLFLFSLLLSGQTFILNGLSYEITSAASPYEVKVINPNGSNGGGYLGNISVPSTVSYSNQTYSVTAVGDDAFKSCPGLIGVTLPSSITAIGNNAFLNCTGLLSFTSLSGTAPTLGTGAFDGDWQANCELFVDANSVSNYASTPWSAFQKVSVSFTTENIRYGITSSTTVKVINLSGPYDIYTNLNGIFEYYNNNINIPATISNNGTNYNVTSIGAGALAYKTTFVLTLPSGITSIEKRAFENYSGQQKIVLPSGVTTIGDFAFSKSGFSSIILPLGLTSLGNSVFSGSRLISMTIPSGITAIGNSLFSDCYELIAVKAPAELTSIGDYAFRNCLNLTTVTCMAATPPVMGTDVFAGNNNMQTNTDLFVPVGAVSAYGSIGSFNAFKATSEAFILNSTIYGIVASNEVKFLNPNADNGNFTATSINIPATVTHGGQDYNITSLGDAAFAFSGLTSITLPSDLKKIGKSTFRVCRSLTSIVLPSGLNSIEEHAFRNSGLTSIQLPLGITTIKKGTFTDCSGLTSVSLPSGLLTIESEAFVACVNLSSIVLPSSLANINNYAFWECQLLTSFTCLATIPPSLGQMVFFGSNAWQSNCDLFVPSGSTSAYAAASQWKDFRNVSATLGTRNAVKNSLVIASNPARDFTLINGLKGKEEISLYDMNGKLLFQGNATGSTFMLNVFPYPNGMYLLKIDAEAHKLLIQK